MWYVRRVQWSAPRRAPHSFLFWFSVQFRGSRGGSHRLLTFWIISHFRAVVNRKFGLAPISRNKINFVWHVGLYHIGSCLSRTFSSSFQAPVFGNPRPVWLRFAGLLRELSPRPVCSVFRASPGSSMNLSMSSVKRYVLLTSRPVSRTLRPSAVCTASWHFGLYHIRSRKSSINLWFKKISCFRAIALLLQCKYGYIPHMLGIIETFTTWCRRYIDSLYTGYALPVCDIRIFIRFYQVCKMRLCTPGYFPFWTAFSPR